MSPDSVFVPISIITVGITLVNFFKYLRAKDWNAVVTYFVVFAVLFLVMWLYGNSQFGTGQVLPGTALPLEDMALDDLLVAALAFTGPAVVLWDGFAAIDRSRTTAKPPLTSLRGGAPPPP